MSWKLTFLVAVAILAVAGVAVAANGGSKGVTLCAAKGDGALSLATGKKCGKGEKKLTISKQGQQGVAGAPGAPGSPGTTASIQPEAVRAIAPAVSGSCVNSPGTFCSDFAISWVNAGAPWAPVGYWKDAAGEVHLRGTINSDDSPGVEDEKFFYLPAGFRPAEKLSFMVPNCDAGEPFVIYVEPSGLVKMRAFASNTCPSFDGVSFRP